MFRQAIMGTYVLYERTFSCQPVEIFFFTRSTDEAKALARKRTNEALLLTVIVEGVPGSVDASA